MEHLLSPAVHAQHPEIGHRPGAIRRRHSQKGPQQQPPDAGVGVAFGFGQGVELLHRSRLPGRPVQPVFQPLGAVGQREKIPLLHHPQPVQHPPLTVLQAGAGQSHPLLPVQNGAACSREQRRGFPDCPGTEQTANMGGGGGSVHHPGGVVGRSGAGNGENLRLPPQGMGRRQIRHPQSVVGGGQHRRGLFPGQLRNCPLPGRRKGLSAFELPFQ